ncbi:MAG TPA: sulfatase-like hydrolase/transferase [Acidobacteriota bacterium]|nr:sulfatase-like hydrolase/transferase [Acidobacteriota bacterium]
MNSLLRAITVTAAVSAAFILILTAGGCGQGDDSSPSAALVEKPDKINILLMTIDTLRTDHLGCYGNEIVETPEIDRIAAEGARFDFCVAHNTVTLPSHVNILTGEDPRTHGVHDNTGFRLRSETVTIAELLKDAGYNTGAFVAAFVLDSRYGIDQGFDLYDDYYGINRPGNPLISERPANEVIDPAMQWIKGQGDEPWFAWIHVYDPHAPHQVAEPFNRNFKDDLYAGEVSFVDFNFKKVFDYLRNSGKIDNTLIIITADHGEGLGDHGEDTHGIFAYNPTLWVPLIIRAPWSIPAGTEVERRVRHIDLLQTILDAAGLEVPEGKEGESLLAVAKTRAPGDAPDSYFEALSASFNRGWAPLRGVLHDNWKYIDLPLPELYDMGGDFQEATNLIDSRAGTAASLRRILAQIREGESNPIETRITESEETRLRLRNLGYLTGANVIDKKTHGPEDDPKNLIGLSNRLDKGVSLATASKWDEAEELLSALIEEQPDMSIAYKHLAWVYTDSGRPQKAVELLDSAAKRGIGGNEILTGLAMALQEAGEARRSVEILEVIRQDNPEDIEILHYLAMGYGNLQEVAKSEELFTKVLEQDPSFLEARGNLGWLLLEHGREQEAMEQFNIALRQFPYHANSLHGKGLIYERFNRLDDAIAAYREALRADRKRYSAMLQLAIVLTRRGNFTEAIPLLERFLKEAPAGKYPEERVGAQRLLARLRQHGS